MRLRAHLVVIFLPIAAPLCAKSQPSFAPVTQETQTARDNDRRMILEAELSTERSALGAAQAAFDSDRSTVNEEGLHRHTENVKALERELDRTGRPVALSRPRLIVKAIRPSTHTAPSAGAPSSFWNPYRRSADLTNSSINQRSERQ